MSSVVCLFFQVCAYQIKCFIFDFSLLLLKDKNICPAFPCFPGHFHCHYYFHYVCLWGYKKLPLHLQVSNIRQCKINRTQHCGMFSKHFRTKTRTARENHHEQKLCYIASQVSIWDYFGISQANYLALDKNEKSRMFSEYYNKLV